MKNDLLFNPFPATTPSNKCVNTNYLLQFSYLKEKNKTCLSLENYHGHILASTVCFFCRFFSTSARSALHGASLSQSLCYHYHKDKVRIRIRIHLLTRRNLLWDILRLPSSRRAALRLYVILTLYRGWDANQPPYTLIHIGAPRATHCSMGDDYHYHMQLDNLNKLKHI